ncbi:hypothetical protein M9458_011684, partial [Cirrhinus mrigala]
EAVRECQRERMNGQTKTILTEKLLIQIVRSTKMKERTDDFSYTTERDIKRDALLDIRQ